MNKRPETPLEREKRINAYLRRELTEAQRTVFWAKGRAEWLERMLDDKERFYREPDGQHAENVAEWLRSQGYIVMKAEDKAA